MLAQIAERPATIAERTMIAMTTGGDERITLNDTTGLNRYRTAPRPDAILSYSSSTANGVSPGAFAAVQRVLEGVAPDGHLSSPTYAEQLDQLRERLRAAYGLPDSVDVVFAASGTDLEYVGLAVARRRDRPHIDNIVLGLSEIGSGCINSAQGLHFAKTTPLGIACAPTRPIDAVLASQTRLVNVEIRNANGVALPSEDVLLDVGIAIELALANNRQPLLHIIHGSKTGLVVPSLEHIDALRRRHGSDLAMVVDACQARISREMILAYLARGITVFLTGSKFMGGPPFSGMALVPASATQRLAPLDAGFASIFNRAEWPYKWPGSDILPDSANLGLLLRLNASVHELELYSRLQRGEIRRTLDLFDDAIDLLTRTTGTTRVRRAGLTNWDGVPPPLEMRTLVTLDLSESGLAEDDEDARALYAALMQDGGTAPAVRLGQPVQCIRLPNGRFAAVLRIGLSMPQMVDFAGLDSASLRERLNGDMATIASAILGWTGRR